MDKKLISRKSLAERWDYESTKAIISMEEEGVLTRVPGVSSPRYSIDEIEKIENLGTSINPLSPIERKRMQKEIEELKKQLLKNNELLRKFTQLSVESMKLLSIK